MSGGSFDYLCYKDADELSNHQETIRDMQRALIELGNQADADKTQQILLAMQEYQDKVNQLLDEVQESWRKVEWYYSGDIGKPDWTKS